MRKTMILFLCATVMSIIAVGCQSADDRTSEVHTTDLVLPFKEMDSLPLEITKINLYQTKGDSSTVYSDVEAIETFRSIIASAEKEAGIVNMMSPDFNLDVIYTDESKEAYHLWIGEEGQKSALMEASDTHTIYTFPEEMNVKLIDLVEQQQ